MLNVLMLAIAKNYKKEILERDSKKGLDKKENVLVKPQQST